MTTIRPIHIARRARLPASPGSSARSGCCAGNRFARWSAFIPTNRVQATELFRQAGFYGFVRKEIPKVLGHNQLAATAYLALFALLLVETVHRLRARRRSSAPSPAPPCSAGSASCSARSRCA